jgi:hypothetical protein
MLACILPRDFYLLLLLELPGFLVFVDRCLNIQMPIDVYKIRIETSVNSDHILEEIMKLPKLVPGIKWQKELEVPVEPIFQIGSVLPSGLSSNPCDDCIDRCLSGLGGSPDLCRYGPCRRDCGV